MNTSWRSRKELRKWRSYVKLQAELRASEEAESERIKQQQQKKRDRNLRKKRARQARAAAKKREDERFANLVRMITEELGKIDSTPPQPAPVPKRNKSKERHQFNGFGVIKGLHHVISGMTAYYQHLSASNPQVDQFGRVTVASLFITLAIEDLLTDRDRRSTTLSLPSDCQRILGSCQTFECLRSPSATFVGSLQLSEAKGPSHPSTPPTTEQEV